METSKLEIISETLSPIYLPNTPEIINEIRGRNNKLSSIIILLNY